MDLLKEKYFQCIKALSQADFVATCQKCLKILPSVQEKYIFRKVVLAAKKKQRGVLNVFFI